MAKEKSLSAEGKVASALRARHNASGARRMLADEISLGSVRASAGASARGGAGGAPGAGSQKEGGRA